MTLLVRDPVIGDFDAINSLGKWFQENSHYAGCGWSETKCLHWVNTGIEPSSNTFMRVVEKDGKIIGFFLGILVEYFFSRTTIAQDLVMVFKPEHRKGIAGSITQLLQEFETWSITKEANEVCIGITSGIAGDGYEKLIQSLGYKSTGVILKKEV